MDRLPSIAQSRRKESVVNHLGSGGIELAGSERIPIHCPFHLHSINRVWNKLQTISTSLLTSRNNTNVTPILHKVKRTLFHYPFYLSRVYSNGIELFLETAFRPGGVLSVEELASLVAHVSAPTSQKQGPE